MFSEPVTGEKFFGREEILELLNKRAVALKEGYRQNIAFTGQSLTGKTSILRQFLSSAKDEEFVAVYIEVIKEPFRSFASRFIATLLYNALLKLGESPDVDLQLLLEKAQKSLPRISAAIKHIISLIDKDEYDEAYSGLLGLTSHLKEEIKLPCVVILDEFDNLEYLGIKNPFLNFGKVIMVQKDTMYIVTSSRNQAIKRILSEKLSLLFGNFEIVRVSGFNLKTAVDFIDTRLAGFELDDVMKKFLIAFSEGNAFYLNRIVNSSKSIALERMSNYVDREIVSLAILNEFANSDGAIHQYLFNFLLDLIDSKCRDLYISCLVSISCGRNKLADISRNLKTKAGEISKALARLSELGLVSKNGIFYKIDDPVLEFWLRHVYQRRKDILVDDISNRTRIMKEEIDNYISSFVEELNKEAMTKIIELFNQFSNELVSIDSKQMRLPHFTKVEPGSTNGSNPFIAATFRGRSWIVQPHKNEVNENDIIDFVRSSKASGYKISNKVIIPLKGIDENAKLLAKELKISIWDLSTVNTLLNLYGKKRFVIL